jgi:hypothetical protein
MTCSFFKYVGRGHPVTRVCTKFLLFIVQGLFAFLDRIAGAFVLVPVGYLVLSAAVERNIAA